MSTNYLGMGLLALTLGVLAPAQAAEPKLPRDGWVNWQVPAVEGAPSWCCHGDRQGRDTAAAVCKLDGESRGYGSRDQDMTTEAVKVYARSSGGKIDKLRVLSAGCPVETNTPVQSLTDVTVDDSTRWLVSQAKQGDVTEDALAALAMHRGDVARTALAAFARGDARPDTRKWSVFWLALFRGSEGADIASSVMFQDQDSEVRQHAAFALSQSKSSRVTPDLIRLGNTDPVGDVRSKAWFWLAHTGAAQSEQAIGAALRQDNDAGVRREAIFALSRLPDDRGTKALIAAAEDRSLSQELRRQAVFWLSQSESDSAQAYLEKVLARVR